MRYVMALGGISVIIAIVLIAFYLVYVVLPMFKPPHIEQAASYPVPAGTQTETLYYAMEEQREIGLRVTGGGSIVFFNTEDGSLVHQQFLAEETLADPTAFAAGDPSQRLLAIGLDDGTALLALHEYHVSYPNDVRVILPGIDWPAGKTPMTIDEAGMCDYRLIAAQYDEEQLTVAALTEDGRLLLMNRAEEESFFSDEAEITAHEKPNPRCRPDYFPVNGRGTQGTLRCRTGRVDFLLRYQ